MKTDRTAGNMIKHVRVRKFLAALVIGVVFVANDSLCEDTLAAEQVKIGIAEGGKDRFWLYTSGESVRVSVPLKIEGNKPEEVKAEWTLSGWEDKVIWTKTQPVNPWPPAGERLAFSFSAPDRFGPYRLALKLQWVVKPGQTESVSRDVAVLGVRNPLWASDRIKAVDSFLGASLHGSEQYARLLGIRWFRYEFIASWTLNSPKPHEYLFASHLEGVKKRRALGIEGYAGLGYCPPWAVEATPEERARAQKQGGQHHFLSARPPNLESWREYVREAITTFKGEIKYWELWNEPQGPIFWMGTPEQYVELLKILHEEVGRIDPQAKILAPGGMGVTYFDPFHINILKLGAAKYVDIWTVHHYECDPYCDVDTFREHVRKLRQLLDENDGKHLAIWNTEGGCAAESMFRDGDFKDWPPLEKRKPIDYGKGYALPKLFVAEKAEAIDKHFYYLLGQNPARFALNSGEPTGALRFTLHPIAAWAGVIDGSTFVEELKKDELGHAYFCQRPDAAVAMLWADLAKGESVPLRIRKADGLKAVDFLGNPIALDTGLSLSLAPAYLEWPGHQVKDLVALVEWASLPNLSNPELLAKRTRIPDLGIPNVGDFGIAHELAGRMTPLDLRPYCNRSFNDEVMGDGKGGWSDEGPNNDFHGVQTGTRVLCGVPFDLIDPKTNNNKSVLSLKSDGLGTGLADALIPVNKQIRGLFILHASQNYTSAGLAYSIVLHYASGKSNTLEVKVPERLNDTWILPNPDVEKLHNTKGVPLTVALENRKVHASEAEWCKKTGNNFVYRFPRITYFENPLPAEGAVTSIEIISAVPHGVPIIMAITLAE